MPAVKLGRDNTAVNLSKLMYGQKRVRKLTNEDLLVPLGVKSVKSVSQRLSDPQGDYFRSVMRTCKRLGITREEFLAAIDY